MTRGRSFSKLERDALAICALFSTTWASPGAIAGHLTNHTIAEVDAALRDLEDAEFVEFRGGFACITKFGLRLIDGAGGAINVLIYGGNGLAYRKRKAA